MRIVSVAARAGAIPAATERPIAARAAAPKPRNVLRRMAILLRSRKCACGTFPWVDGSTRRSPSSGQTKTAAAIAGRYAHALAVFVKRPQAEAQIGAGENLGRRRCAVNTKNSNPLPCAWLRSYDSDMKSVL